MIGGSFLGPGNWTLGQADVNPARVSDLTMHASTVDPPWVMCQNTPRFDDHQDLGGDGQNPSCF